MRQPNDNKHINSKNNFGSVSCVGRSSDSSGGVSNKLLLATMVGERNDPAGSGTERWSQRAEMEKSTGRGRPRTLRSVIDEPKWSRLFPARGNIEAGGLASVLSSPVPLKLECHPTSRVPSTENSPPSLRMSLTWKNELPSPRISPHFSCSKLVICWKKETRFEGRG